MKMVVFEVEDWERERFQSLAEEHEIVFQDEKLTKRNAAEFGDAEILSVFIYSQIDSSILDRLPSLKLIATRSTGYDHIDLEACNRRDIQVCNVPTYAPHTVSEYVFALLLAISRKIVDARQRTLQGDFNTKGLQGFDLHGKTIGIVGTGDIGNHVAEIANGFGMKVIAYDVKPDEEAAREHRYEYVDMDELLKRSDVITLHVPGNEKTRHLISMKEFEKMKDGVVIINTARGFVIDVQALSKAIADGKVAGAGLDVLPEEHIVQDEIELLRAVFYEEHDLPALLANQLLMNLRSVIVTPHNAFNSREAVQRILDTTVENIHAFLQGEPQNVVNEHEEQAK